MTFNRVRAEARQVRWWFCRRVRDECHGGWTIYWSTRRLAKEAGLSVTTVRMIRQAHGLTPHLVRGFKLSHDKRFVEKLEDIVGLYLNALDHVLVLKL